MDSFLVENSFYIVNFRNLKCYNFRCDENISLSQKARVVSKNKVSKLIQKAAAKIDLKTASCPIFYFSIKNRYKIIKTASFV